MPNWCEAEYRIFGDKAQLVKLYMDWTDATSKNPKNFKPVDNSWDNMWVGNLFLEAGYRENEWRNVHCRGDITHLEVVGDFEAIGIGMDLAWSPNDEDIDTLLSKNYPGLSEVMWAEEPGCGIYINTDRSGRFFKEKYKVAARIDEDWFEEYAENEEGVNSIISGFTKLPEAKGWLKPTDCDEVAKLAKKKCGWWAIADSLREETKPAERVEIYVDEFTEA